MGAACLGALTQIVQVILLRQVLTMSQSGELVAGGALAAWFLMWGAGSLVAASGGRTAPALVWRGLPVVWLAAWGALLLGANAREVLGLPPHAPLGPWDALGLSALVMGPPAAFAGMVYGVAVRGTAADTARRIYQVETAGSVVAGALLATPLMERAGSEGAMALAVVSIGLARTVAARRPFTAASLCGGAAIMLCAGLIPLTGGLLDRPWSRLVAGATAVVRRELRQAGAVAVLAAGQTNLFLGGRLAASWPARQEREEPVALAMLQHPAPARVLLWGGRASQFVRPAIALGARHVTLLVEDPGRLELERARFEGLAAELDRPGVAVAIGDPRAYLMGHRDGPSRFDVILLDTPSPSTTLGHRLFSAEGLAGAAGALAEGGVLALPLASASAAGTMPPAFKRRNLALVSTMKSVFAEVRAVPGECELLLARKAGVPGRGCASLTLAGAELSRRLAARPGLAHVTPASIGELVPRLAAARLAALYDAAPPRAVCTDAMPVLCRLTQEAEAAGAPPGARMTRAGVGLLAAILALTVVLVMGRGGPTAVRPLIALSGIVCGATICQVLLLVVFQTLFGSLYREIGLITGLALAGVAAGSSRAWDRAPVIRGITSLGRLSAALALSACAVAAVPANPGGGGAGALYAAILGLAAWIGACSGRAYVLALRAAGPRADSAARCYAADMLGAAAGGAATAGLLLPALGIPGAALVAAALATGAGGLAGARGP